jgi:cation diffusion facilitator family transporter
MTDERSTRTPETAALAGLLVNAALAAIKLVAGLVGHSYALVADAVESMADILGSVVIWGALRYGGRPADEGHPFGHGKAEALAALAVACLIIVAGIGIAIKAVDEIVTPHLAPAPFTLFVLIGVVGVKEALYQMARRAAHRSESSAGLADAWHHRSDAITSIFAFIGISVALLGGPAWAVADDWAALLASGVIVTNGALLMRQPYAELLDRAAPSVAERCSRLAMDVPGIEAIEQVHARKTGRTYRVIMHAEVAPSMTVRDAHTLTGRVKAAVRSTLPRVESLLIHVEPHEGGAGGSGTASTPPAEAD